MSTPESAGNGLPDALAKVLGEHHATSVLTAEDIDGHYLVDCSCGVILGTTNSPNIPERHNLHIARVVAEYLSADRADEMVEAPCIRAHGGLAHEPHEWQYEHTLHGPEWRRCPGRPDHLARCSLGPGCVSLGPEKCQPCTRPLTPALSAEEATE